MHWARRKTDFGWLMTRSLAGQSIGTFNIVTKPLFQHMQTNIIMIKASSDFFYIFTCAFQDSTSYNNNIPVLIICNKY